MTSQTIPPGFTLVSTPDGDKITKGDGVFILIRASDSYLKALAQSSLNSPSEQLDVALFPGGSFERVNDYVAMNRNFEEKDDAGAVVNSFTTPIQDSEVDARLIREDFNAANAAILAESPANPLRAPLLQLMRHLNSVSPANTAIVQVAARPVKARVGTTVNMEVRMSRSFNGLSGFIFSASIGDGRTAKFVDVVFPVAFPLATHDPDPVDGPTLNRAAGVDLASAIQGQQNDILLATLRIEALAVGTTDIVINVTALDDDSGFPIRNIASGATIEVA